MSDAQEDTPADPPKDTVGATTYESTGGAPGGQVDEEL
jgi:hypothetical protein